MVSILKSSSSFWRIYEVDALLDPENDVDHEVKRMIKVKMAHNLILWEVALIFNGSQSLTRDWISLDVRMIENHRMVKAMFKIWLVNVNDTWIRMNYDTHMEIDNSRTYNVPDFINKDDLFVNFEEYAPRNALTFTFEFDIDSYYKIPRVLSKRDKIEREDREQWSYYGDEAFTAPKRLASYRNWFC